MLDKVKGKEVHKEQKIRGTEDVRNIKGKEVIRQRRHKAKKTSEDIRNIRDKEEEQKRR